MQNFGSTGSAEEAAVRRHAATAAQEALRVSETRRRDVEAWEAYLDTYSATGVRNALKNDKVALSLI